MRRRIEVRGCYELCELACASTIVPLLLTQLLFYALSLLPFFPVNPLQQELIRNSACKPNKNKALASENNLPQSGILVSPNQLIVNTESEKPRPTNRGSSL